LPSLLARQQQQQEKLFAKIYESLNRLKSSFNLIAKCKIVFRFFLAFLLAKSEKKNTAATGKCWRGTAANYELISINRFSNKRND
jgi:hypothetical protein